LPQYIPTNNEFQYEIVDRGFHEGQVRLGKLPFPTIGYNLPDDYAGHPILSAQNGTQLGWWAPDYESSEHKYEVVFLAISRCRGLVNCLGLAPLDEKGRIYKRIGLGFWHEVAWDESSPNLDPVDMKIV